MTGNGMELHTEEIDFNGLSIKFFVKPHVTTGHYMIVCKAYDKSRAMLWSTEILDENGKPKLFHSLAAAVTKTRSIFSVYDRERASV